MLLQPGEDNPHRWFICWKTDHHPTGNHMIDLLCRLFLFLRFQWYKLLFKIACWIGKWRLRFDMLIDDLREWPGHRIYLVWLIVFLHLWLKFVRWALWADLSLILPLLPVILLLILYSSSNSYDRGFQYIGGPLPFDAACPTTYYDIWETQMNENTESYKAYYSYIWVHWHEMEERILLFLSIRNLLLGI